MDNTISKIENDSPLHRRAHVGDVLVSINGNKVHDVLDYKFYGYDPVLAVTLRRPDGTEHTVHVEKAEGQDLGLEFTGFICKYSGMAWKIIVHFHESECRKSVEPCIGNLLHNLLKSV